MSQKRDRGFTLIEIMAVVLIIGLLTGLVGVAVFGQFDTAKVRTARAQIDGGLKSALEAYRMDNGRYPTTEQGLDALVHRPTIAPEPNRWNPDGYLDADAVPLDPWGNPYQYQSPGTRNPRKFDIWSFGADGSPGGEENDADIGNWTDTASTASR
jgi:general secretion pathway protein G